MCQIHGQRENLTHTARLGIMLTVIGVFGRLGGGSMMGARAFTRGNRCPIPGERGTLGQMNQFTKERAAQVNGQNRPDQTFSPVKHCQRLVKLMKTTSPLGGQY